MILGVLASASSAAAEPITFEFTGEVTSVIGIDPALSGLFSVGDPISGTYTFDSLAPDTRGESIIGEYATDTFSVQVGPKIFGGGPTDYKIIIVNDRFGDTYSVKGTLFPEVSIGLLDNDATAIVSDSLLLVPPDLSSFETRLLLMKLEIVEIALPIDTRV